MPTFRVNESHETAEPQITVETGPRTARDPFAPQITLQPGRHQFQLVVVDDQGNRSEPAVVTVTVRPAGVRPPGPDIVIRPGPVDPFRPR